MDAFDEMRVTLEGDEPHISPSLLNEGLGLISRLRSSNTVYGWVNRQNHEAADEIERMHALLRRGVRQLEAWNEFYGRNCNGSTMGNILPPSGDLQWIEDVSDVLMKPNIY